MSDKKNTISLTYGDLQKYSLSLDKLRKTNGLKDFQDAIKISKMAAPIDQMLKDLTSASNTIVFKYLKIAEDRKEVIFIRGQPGLTSVEAVAKNDEMEVMLKGNAGTLNVEKLKESTIENLYLSKIKSDETPGQKEPGQKEPGQKEPGQKVARTPKEEFIITIDDLAAFAFLGLI